MQKCRDWIRRKDNRKKLLLPVLFFLFLMVGSLLCLLWLQLGATAGWGQGVSAHGANWSWLREAAAHTHCQVEGLAAGM